MYPIYTSGFLSMSYFIFVYVCKYDVNSKVWAHMW